MLSTNKDIKTTIFSSMTWNIETIRRNIFNLKHFASQHLHDFRFISEPEIFSNDLNLVLRPIQGEYRCSLNSADKYDPELPLLKSRAHGGTLALWKVEHDPFVSIPGFNISVPPNHLPTSKLTA